ncbi:MAG TPA: type I methionyl aminopeptidase [Terriglobales bacterium]|nr:type I methionyl aminopeptidase [Terriglobales bacterium]
MIVRRSPQELERLRRSGLVVHEVLRSVAAAVRPGVSTWDLEEIAQRAIKERGATPAFRGYRGYPCVLCASVNDQVVHGIPTRKRILAAGDVVSLDCGVVLDGYYGDAAMTTVAGGEELLSPSLRRLLDATRESLAAAIEVARPGNYLGDISHAVQRHVEASGFSVVREFVGHGIGTHLHEEPQIPNFGAPGSGPKLREGMVLAIEPMVNQGSAEVRMMPDGWTAVTADGGYSAHFEHTVAITKDGPWILTQP